MNKNPKLFNTLFLIASICLIIINTYIYVVEKTEIKAFLFRIIGNILIAAVFAFNLYRLKKEIQKTNSINEIPSDEK